MNLEEVVARMVPHWESEQEYYTALKDTDDWAYRSVVNARAFQLGECIKDLKGLLEAERNGIKQPPLENFP